MLVGQICLPQKSHHFPLQQGRWTLSQIPPGVCCSLNLCRGAPFTEFELLSPSSESCCLSALTCSLPLSSSTLYLQHQGSPLPTWAFEVSSHWSFAFSLPLLSLCCLSCSVHITLYIKPTLLGKTTVIFCHSFYTLTTGCGWPFCDLPSAFPSTWKVLSPLSGEFLFNLQDEGQGFTF